MKTRLEVTVSTKDGGKTSPNHCIHRTGENARFYVVFPSESPRSKLVADAMASP